MDLYFDQLPGRVTVPLTLASFGWEFAMWLVAGTPVEKPGTRGIRLKSAQRTFCWP